MTDCDCPLDPFHRWNCSLTPIWAQTMRDLDVNPWTCVIDRQPSPEDLKRLRFQPIAETLRDVIADANLTITVTNPMGFHHETDQL